MQSMESEISLFSDKLRVLVVDDDPVCVKIITQMLKQCNYEVTEVAKASEALETLRENPKSFDMVITDTYNDIDVLSLIVKILKLENIPVILVSGLEDTSTLIQGVVQGADEVLSKPISLAKIKTLWQHVYRRKLNQMDQDSEEEEGDEESEQRRKKARVRWQGSLQEKFVQAVVQLGGPWKAMPKKIMELMNVPVSRESVASHLQKYRKQKKPFGYDQNDTNFAVSPFIAQRTNHHHHHHSNVAAPPLSHSCYHAISNNIKSMAPDFNYHHRHHSGFQYNPKPVSGLNLMTRSNACSSSSSSSLWRVPKPDPGFGMMPDQQPSMLPPLPTCVPPQPSPVVPISSRGGYIANCSSNSLVRAPPQWAAGDDNTNTSSFSFSGEPWQDSGVLDDAFFSMCEMFGHDQLSHSIGLNPEGDEWLLEDNYESGANGAVMRDAAGGSPQQYSSN